MGRKKKVKRIFEQEPEARKQRGRSTRSTQGGYTKISNNSQQLTTDQENLLALQGKIGNRKINQILGGPSPENSQDNVQRDLEEDQLSQDLDFNPLDSTEYDPLRDLFPNDRPSESKPSAPTTRSETPSRPQSAERESPSERDSNLRYQTKYLGQDLQQNRELLITLNSELLTMQTEQYDHVGASLYIRATTCSSLIREISQQTRNTLEQWRAAINQAGEEAPEWGSGVLRELLIYQSRIAILETVIQDLMANIRRRGEILVNTDVVLNIGTINSNIIQDIQILLNEVNQVLAQDAEVQLEAQRSGD